jgi:hypothetical protein
MSEMQAVLDAGLESWLWGLAFGLFIGRALWKP